MSSRKNRKPVCDFRSPQDEAWYTIRGLVLEKETQTLIIKYLDFPNDDDYYSVATFKTHEAMEKFKKRFRRACIQVQDRKCQDVKKGMRVCCSSNKAGVGKEVRFYNAEIDSVDPQPHQRRGRKMICKCSWGVVWSEGPNVGYEESMRIARICRLDKETLPTDPSLTSFFRMLEEKLQLQNNGPDSSSDKDADEAVEGIGKKDLKKKKKTAKGSGLDGNLMASTKKRIVVAKKR